MHLLDEQVSPVRTGARRSGGERQSTPSSRSAVPGHAFGRRPSPMRSCRGRARHRNGPSLAEAGIRPECERAGTGCCDGRECPVGSRTNMELGTSPVGPWHRARNGTLVSAVQTPPSGASSRSSRATPETADLRTRPGAGSDRGVAARRGANRLDNPTSWGSESRAGMGGCGGADRHRPRETSCSAADRGHVGPTSSAGDLGRAASAVSALRAEWRGGAGARVGGALAWLLEGNRVRILDEGGGGHDPVGERRGHRDLGVGEWRATCARRSRVAVSA
jgi:hypothetical protein